MRFVVKGVMDLGTETRKFSKNVEANKKERAVEIVCTLLGAAHRMRKNRIKIESVAEYKREDE